jgi:N-acetylglucosaminylphosphatidylinositol deacetylase
LELSCKALGFAEVPIIINDPDLQDGPNQHWAPNLIQEQVERVLKTKAEDGEAINMIVTFDEGGISGHQNHIDVCNSIVQLFKSGKFEFELYTL